MFHMLGVVRPDFDVEDSWFPPDLMACSDEERHHFFAVDGNRVWSGARSESFPEENTITWFESIGLLLDLDEGSLTLYTDDVRCAVMVEAGGLNGEYCWAAGLGIDGHSVRIESAPLPEDCCR
jgi:hypothetical protein